MPHGPKGEWRPAETGPCAVHVMKIATGEIEETFEPPKRDADHVAASRRASKAGKARAASMTPEERRASAKLASDARWAGR